MKTNKELYIITPGFKDKYLKTIEDSINRYDNLTLLQLRDKTANISQTEEFIKKILIVVNRANVNREQKVKIILNSYNNFCKELSDIESKYLIDIYNLDGIQESLFNDSYEKTVKKYKDKFNILSCHSKNDILIAKKMKFDAVTLSAIFKTKSHPYETRLIGVDRLKSIVGKVDFPIYALGGINFQNINSLDKINDLVGYALISAFFYSN